METLFTGNILKSYLYGLIRSYEDNLTNPRDTVMKIIALITK